MCEFVCVCGCVYCVCICTSVTLYVYSMYACTYMYRCLEKVFIPLELFHILPPYNHTLKYFSLRFYVRSHDANRCGVVSRYDITSGRVHLDVC